MTTQQRPTPKSHTRPAGDPRVACAKALARVVRDGQSLTTALNDVIDSVEAKDVGLLRELCFGVARFAPAYDRLANKLLSKALKPGESEVKMLLYVGFYQLDQTRIPDHAAINSVVDAAKKLHKPWATGLLNGVLRHYLRDREGIQQTLTSDPSYQYAHPQWLIDQLRSAWPNAWQAILTANNAHPPMTLRVNARYSLRNNYTHLLNDAHIDHRPGAYSSVAISLDKACDVAALPNFAKGWVAVQDEAAQLSAELLALAPKQRVLDACCAPGGKSCHILEHEPSLDELVAIDVEENRMARVRDNIERLIVDKPISEKRLADEHNPSSPAAKTKITLKIADASAIASWWDGKPFDRILLDAPCSATGVIRRHPDIKLLRRPTDIPKLAELQQLLLRELWQTLKPGGILVYATCSVLPRENEHSIEKFLAVTPDAEHLPLNDVTWGAIRPLGRQLFPQVDGHDGFYYCRLLKK